MLLEPNPTSNIETQENDRALHDLAKVFELVDVNTSFSKGMLIDPRHEHHRVDDLPAQLPAYEYANQCFECDGPESIESNRGHGMTQRSPEQPLASLVRGRSESQRLRQRS